VLLSFAQGNLSLFCLDLIFSAKKQQAAAHSPVAHFIPNSGTEPKFKYYIELRGCPGESKSAVQKRLTEMSALILEELLHPKQNGLIIPSSL
jgi:hypothetical protein